MSKHLSLRVDEDLLLRLEAQSHRTGQSRSAVAKRFLEEGLRMEQHPGVVFRSGPAGRRAAVLGGPDVWVLARLLREREGPAEETVACIAGELALTPAQVRAAAGYYAEFRDEVDGWLDRLDGEADRAEAEWRRQQAILSG